MVKRCRYRRKKERKKREGYIYICKKEKSKIDLFGIKRRKSKEKEYITSDDKNGFFKKMSKLLIKQDKHLEKNQSR